MPCHYFFGPELKPGSFPQNIIQGRVGCLGLEGNILAPCERQSVMGCGRSKVEGYLDIGYCACAQMASWISEDLPGLWQESRNGHS